MRKIRTAAVATGLLLAAMSPLAAACSTGTAGGGTGDTAGVHQGVGAKDASKDITLGRITVEPTYGTVTGTVTITNHSSERSDYFVTVTIYDAQGTNIGDALATKMGVEPAQKAMVDLFGSIASDRNAATWDHAKVTEVQRTASLG